MNDGIHFPYIGQEFIAQPFALAGATNQARYINDLDLRWNDPVRLHQSGQLIQPGVGYIHQAGIGFDGTEPVVARLCLGAVAHRIE